MQAFLIFISAAICLWSGGVRAQCTTNEDCTNASTGHRCIVKNDQGMCGCITDSDCPKDQKCNTDRNQCFNPPSLEKAQPSQEEPSSEGRPTLGE